MISKQEDENEHEKALTIAIASELEEEGKSDVESQHRSAKNEGWGNNSQDTAARSNICKHIRQSSDHRHEFQWVWRKWGSSRQVINHVNYEVQEWGMCGVPTTRVLE